MSTLSWDVLPGDLLAVSLLATVALGLFLLFSVSRGTKDVKELPCPPGAEFLWGHERAVFKNAASAKFSEWFEACGPAYRIKGALFHPDITVLGDRAAIHHVFTSHMHNYTRAPFYRKVIEGIVGRGISWSEGALHKRFRKLLEPAFSTVTVKTMAQDVFVSSSAMERCLTKYLEANNSSAVVDITHWTAAATLDTIGRVGFGYDFHGGQSSEAQEILEEWGKLSRNAMSTPAFYAEVVIRGFPWLLSLPLDFAKSQGVVKSKVTRLAMSIIEKGGDVKTDRERRNVLDILLNAAGEGKMSIEEIIDNICLVFFAGFETTAMTLNMILYELARNPAVQQKLRDEINSLMHQPTYEDFMENSALPYLDAIIKEGLRLYPAMVNNGRVAVEADVIPLSEPIMMPSGRVLKEIRVEAGQAINIPSMSVNRLSNVWDDGDAFRPERWIEQNGLSPNVKLQNGWSNILTFSMGPRLCLGYKLALLELKSITTSLVRRFEFHATGEVENKMAVVLQTRVVGQEEKGVQLPLKVTLVAPGY